MKERFVVRKLNIPDQPSSPEPAEIITPRAKALNIPDSAPNKVEADRGPKILNVPEPKEVLIERTHVPVAKSLNIPDQVYVPPQKVVKRTKTDDLIDAARVIDPTIDAIRLRGRIDSLLSYTITQFLDWGERNLAPLRAASSVQSKIASRMAQINASGWLNEAMEASCKKPSSMALWGKKKGPDFYESMLLKTRAEMLALVDEMNNIRSNYEPDVRDLQLDAISLTVVANDITDPTNQPIATNRAKSLIAAHQTGAMLLQAIVNTKLQCAQFVQQIDDFMNVTMPNWKMAYTK